MTTADIRSDAKAVDWGRRTIGPAVVVWLIWAATVASVLVAIARDGRNIPFEEDWLMVGPMTGHEPDIPDWLWSQNSEHRLPLPRLVNLALLRTTGDFRSTMVLDTLAVAALAAVMILVARRLRGGRTGLADVFFPLLLLQLGNWDNLVWGWQIQFVLPTVLAGVLLVVIAARPFSPAPRATAVAALALIGLPLSGANGLVFTPTLAAWLAYATWPRGATKPSRPNHWLPVGAAAIAVCLCAAYFIGYESSPWNQASPGPGATLTTTGKFLALSLGPAAAKRWLLCGGVAGLAFLVAIGLLIASYPRNREERLRILGLLAFFSAAAVLALAIGWGRAGRAAATGRMPTRYVLLAAPGLCAVYFTGLLYGTAWTRRLFTGVLAAVLTLLFPFNTRVGFERRAWFEAGFASFERDLHAGAPSEVLADRHHDFMLHWDESLMAVSIQRLHDARIGPFAGWEPASGQGAITPDARPEQGSARKASTP